MGKKESTFDCFLTLYTHTNTYTHTHTHKHTQTHTHIQCHIRCLCKNSSFFPCIFSPFLDLPSPPPPLPNPSKTSFLSYFAERKSVQLFKMLDNSRINCNKVISPCIVQMWEWDQICQISRGFFCIIWNFEHQGKK